MIRLIALWRNFHKDTTDDGVKDIEGMVFMGCDIGKGVGRELEDVWMDGSSH